MKLAQRWIMGLALNVEIEDLFTKYRSYAWNAINIVKQA